MQLPQELPENFRWDDAVLGKKLAEVQKTTKLKTYSGKLSKYNEKWMAIFGRLETRVPLPVVPNLGGERIGVGFGHLGAAPAELVFCRNCTRELKSAK